MKNTVVFHRFSLVCLRWTELNFCQFESVVAIITMIVIMIVIIITISIIIIIIIIIIIHIPHCLMFINTIFQTKITYMFTVESYTCRTLEHTIHTIRCHGSHGLDRLLQQNADANATNQQGATPLDFAKKDSYIVFCFLNFPQKTGTHTRF